MPSFGRSRALTGSGLDSTTSAAGRRAIVKSVQRGTFTLASTLSGTATITAVDPNNAEAVFLGITQQQANVNFAVAAGKLTLTNSTTVTGTMEANASNAAFSYEVVEYFPGVLKSAIQRGTIAVGANASATATVTTVNTSAAKLGNMGWSVGTSAVSTTDQYATKSVLTNSTTITANRVTADANNTITVAYQLSEYF